VKYLHLIALGVLYLGSLALSVAAQNAALVGTARDAQQSVMPNVVITLTNMETGVSSQPGRTPKEATNSRWSGPGAIR
jgi:hypothetical protein